MIKKMFQDFWRKTFGTLVLTGAFWGIELFAWLLLLPGERSPLLFGGLWALLLALVCGVLPRKAGRILFGILYFLLLLWTMAQTGYYSVFGRMMWFRDASYAGEGADYLGDVLKTFPAFWWIGGILLLALGAAVLWKFPQGIRTLTGRLVTVLVSLLAVAGLFLTPELVFVKDLGIWGTRSEYAQSSSYRATYNTMYDAKNTYNITGIYQLAFRDVWKHHLYPLTSVYRKAMEEQTQHLDTYFAQRPEKQPNEMTGIFSGKNVVLVLMESMDDWMITPEDTPTLYRMMQQGICFTEFYTPGYGTARTINSEFCMNTGIYLPTNGGYVFDYVTNSFRQSLASQMTDNGYSAQVFHYNTPDFYSRGVFEPAMGYLQYNCYEDYETDANRLYDDCLLFDIPEMKELFFREGQTFNTIITRSAHLSYVYNEVLSHYALKQYPGYRGKYGSEEEDCARVKAKLVDDLFARLLQELSEAGQLENTVIMAMTDHYTYGYKNMDELYAHSGVEDALLLEKTPCFVWSVDCPNIAVSKTANTSDFVPTMLNLMGVDSPHNYLGQDVFDPRYEGYALFPNGSWISDGVACKVNASGYAIIQNQYRKDISRSYLDEMAKKTHDYIAVNNLLLSSDYYR